MRNRLRIRAEHRNPRGVPRVRRIRGGRRSVVAPMYITEISPTRQRGVLGSLQQLGIVLGIFVSLLVNALLVHVSGGAGTMMGP
mgnify:CR=1 FL=1